VGGCFVAEEAAQTAVCSVEWAAVRQAEGCVACYPGGRVVQKTAAVAEAAGPIVAEGHHPIAAEGDPIVGSEADTAGDIGSPCTVLGLAEDSPAVAADSLEVVVDSLGEAVDNLEEAAGPDSPGSGGLVGDGRLKAAQ
jgi:hypothetical protein